MTEDLPSIELIAQTRRAWIDPWVPRPWLFVRSIDWPLTGAGSARLARHYGEIDDGDGVAVTYDPAVDGLADQFVRICRPPDEDEGEEPIAVWHGMIVADSDTQDGVDAAGRAGGVETFAAVGLEMVLSRRGIATSIVLTAGGWKEISDVLPFNLPAAGDVGPRGNRSAAKVSSPAGGSSYVFAADDSESAALWTGEQILEYALAWLAPAALGWTLEGAGNLSRAAGVVPPARNVLELIDRIVDRRRGHGRRVDVTAGDNGDTAAVTIVSLFGADVAAGGITLDAAGVQAALETDLDEISRGVIVRRESTHVFDRIVVRGSPLVLVGTFKMSDGSLVAGWDAADAVDYLGSSDADRKAEGFADVYRKFAADPAEIPGGPTVNDGGGIDTSTDATAYSLGKGFERRIPVESGATGALAKPLVLIRGATAAGDVWAPIDRPLGPDGLSAGMGVGIVSGEMAIRITGRWAHFLAAGHVDGALPFDKRQPAVFDYDHLVATLAWQSTERLQVAEDLFDASNADAPRVLVIDVPEAECWVRLDETVTDIADGALVTSPAKILRNDRDQLAAVAALAKAWYGRPRRAVTVVYDTLEFDLRPGDFVHSLTSRGHGATEVATAISRIRWDGDAGRTTVQTDFAELDFPAAAGIRPAGGGGWGNRHPGGAVRDGEGLHAHRRGIARIVSGGPGAEYSITEQVWDPVAMAWVHSSADHALAAADAHEWAENDTLAVGQLVTFWQERDEDGQLATFVRGGGFASPGSAGSYPCRAHYSGAGDTTAAFFVVPNCLEAFVEIGVDVRQCAQDGNPLLTGHPGSNTTERSVIGSGRALGNVFATGLGDDETWHSLEYSLTDKIGAGGFAPDLYVEWRCTSDGNGEFRVRNDAAIFSAVIQILLRLTPCPPPPGTIEIGNCCCHEPVPGVWGEEPFGS